MLYILFHKEDSYAKSYLWSDCRNIWSASALLGTWEIKEMASGYDSCQNCSVGTDFAFFEIHVNQCPLNQVIDIGHGWEGGYGPKSFVGKITRQIIDAGQHEPMRSNGAKLFAQVVLSLCTPNAVLMLTCHALRWIADEKEVLAAEGMPRIRIYATDKEFSNLMMPVLIKQFLMGGNVSLGYVDL